MSSSKLFDYNSSFSVLRTNPSLSGNLKITVDSSGGVSFNSMNVNQTLSSNRFKKFNITGQNSYALDIYNFLDQGKISSDVFFQVGTFTRGNLEAVKNFYEEYDFFYASGASTLIDKNYNESFSYFAPLWLKNEIPDYFVIFKVPEPVSYKYSDNVSAIESGVKYKIIQKFESEETFTISYGKTLSGETIIYSAGEIFTGSSEFSTYEVISGSGIVTVFDELKNIDLVDDVENYFKEKILNNASIVKTFDISENTKIGKYIRNIFNDPNFSNSPIDINWGPNSYTYFKGVSISDGIFTKKGEILSDYMASSDSDVMINFESRITGGFSRNGIVCPNLLNLEFLFDDEDSDLYTINRYFGMYVSRNDFSTLRLNGEFFWNFRNSEGNNDYPKPPRNAFGYYYDMNPYGVTSDSGVRLYYENADGFLPGSNDVNIYDSNKIFYLTDKDGNFYNLKKNEEYEENSQNSPQSSYGPYSYSAGVFSATGSTGATSGNVVLQDESIDLLNFTGITAKRSTIKGFTPDSAGRAYGEIEFLKQYDKDLPLTFRLYWPNGSFKDGTLRYDVVQSGDFAEILVWVEGSYYYSGSSFYFNARNGTVSQIAEALSFIMDQVNFSTWDSGYDNGSTITRVRDFGEYGNLNYFIGAYSDYSGFTSLYKGVWDNTKAYNSGDVVLFDGGYFKALVNIPLGFSDNPYGNEWEKYYTFEFAEYIKINGTDASNISGVTYFKGGTRKRENRIVFSSENLGLVNVGDFIGVRDGFSKVKDICRFVDLPVYEPDSDKVIGFNNFAYESVIVLEDQNVFVDFGSDKSFNVHKAASLNFGVFTFFDVKEFDFDFWYSNYGYTPVGETYKYYQIQPGVSGSIKPNVPYIVKQGQVTYGNSTTPIGDSTTGTSNRIFYGVTGFSSYTNANPDLFKQTVVYPAQFSDIIFEGIGGAYGLTGSGYNTDLDSFSGFIGIQSLNPGSLPENATKLDIFTRGKLGSEYSYLEENYNTSLSNISRIVPYINKWVYLGGSDARGNRYRLNSSPAFTPTNFSPSLDRNSPDPRYLTHEWFLLQTPPPDFPLRLMNDQNSYLSSDLDMNLLESADPVNELYLSSYFTVEPEDYPIEFRDLKSYTKELFSPLVYNKTNGFYETLFRGIKITFKRRSNLQNPLNDSLDRYVPRYRGYEDYKFSAVLRPIYENTTDIQSPVRYEIIENTQQKFIVFVCDVVMSDYKSIPVGSTGDIPYLDYTLLYSLSNKESLVSATGEIGERFYRNGDVKLSCALDLSVTSGSFVNTASSGSINLIPNEDYDTDLRDEIHSFFVETTDSTSSTVQDPTGFASFKVPSFSSSPVVSYPWPTGVGPNYISFGRVTSQSATGAYYFVLPFSTADPVTIPFGSQTIYRNKPVFQVEGGLNYYDAILRRISASELYSRINSRSQFIKYTTYSWDGTQTVSSSGQFEINLERPTRIIKNSGSYPTKFFGGPKNLSDYNPTAYNINTGSAYSSTLLRYSGEHEPLTRKIIHFDKDKSDSLFGYGTLDLSFRNCNFAPAKYYFGVIKNLNFSKVSLGNNILSLSQNLPEGPVYPLVDQSPIWKKDFNTFQSTWDPGYYEFFTGPSTYQKVAGTRSMIEGKTFFGSKMMQTPFEVDFDNYIILQISRTSGNSDVNFINSQINSFLESIQSITPENSGTGIGKPDRYLSGTDYNKMDLAIFPNAELIWQYFPETKTVGGIIRLDRMLRRYLLNEGIKKVFIDNIISDFGVGDPNSIDDDVNAYIDNNVSVLYQGLAFDLFVNEDTETGISDMDQSLIVRGDLSNSDFFKFGYYPETNFKLTKINDLIYSFEYNLSGEFAYYMQFNLKINKI
jgi:hypothetical protein